MAASTSTRLETTPAKANLSCLPNEGFGGAIVLSELQMNPVILMSRPPRFPVETWESILANLTSPGDLYNVSVLSRYFHDIVNPILYRRLFFDPNYYSTYTLSLLKHDPELAHRIVDLTLLSPILRDIPTCLRVESEELYRTLDIPCAPIPSDAQLVRYWSPAGMPQLSELDEEVCTRPVLHLFPSFTGLTTLRIVKDCLPCDFLHWISELPQLTDLEIQDSMISADFQPKQSPTPFPLRTLSILRCWTKAEIFENYIPGKICEGLLRNAPFLTSLTVDLFVERAACHVLSEMDPPPPIQTLSCHGLGPHDPDCTLFCSVLSNLPTITTLNMTRTPRELGPVLPKESLRQLRNLTGQIRSLGIFFGVNRPLEYLTIVDSPVANGRASWESQLIYFFESVKRYGPKLKGLAFNVSEWSEEVFLCVYKLWPGLKELRIQCTTGPGVDEYFRISFGPRFLPKLRNLEVLHIYQKALQHGSGCHMTKGVPVITNHPLTLSPDEAEELAEAPIHYRRWEKIRPSLREVAFDREIWWRRISSRCGSWTLMRDVIPALAQEST